MPVVRRRVIVRGVVQGVGFRMNTRAEALRRGVAGSARNRSDGAVEVELIGDTAAVAELIDWLHSGPRFADVSSVEVEDLPPDLSGAAGRDHGFDVG